MKPARPGTPMIRASILTPLVAALDHSGARARTLLARHGLSRVRLDNPYEMVPLRQYVACFEDAADLLDEPTLGLRLGQAFRPEHLGPVGLLFISAPRLQVALERLSRFLNAWQSATRMEIIRGAEYTDCLYQIEDPSIWPRQQDTEFSMASFCALIRGLVGPRWRPAEVHFEHSAPADLKPMTELFRAPLRFGVSVSKLVVRSEDLDRPVGPGGDAMAPFIERHLHDLMQESGTGSSLEERVGFIVAKRLGRAPATVRDVAEEMGLSPRTLQRRLAEANISFRDVVRAQRRRTAERLMQAGEKFSTIAQSINYADAAVLSRAVRSWTGVSPRTHARALEEERARDNPPDRRRTPYK
ncbi:MAG TPA: AraC family transcriptional regulator [Acetobacteraceae bacterium]|nr:AraC family transcriptional regulator [Acetobacteraceae bacterium]